MLYGLGRESDMYDVNNPRLRDDCAKVLMLMLTEDGMPSLTYELRKY